MSQLANARAHEHAAADNKSIFGFWVYLMTDCIVFATLFATYAVLHNNTYGGPSAGQLFSLPFVLTETMLLLISSFTCGLAMLAIRARQKNLAIGWFVLTFLLGAGFLAMELYEFSHLVHEGESWRRSGFLSAFFTLVGTHGLHITIGLLWIGVMLFRVMRDGITRANVRRLTMLSLFWHFLDIVWIFIFTFVYLMGAM